jgi:hypothetical protein
VAQPLGELAETVWADLVTLACGDPEPAPVLARLDDARDEYCRAYSDARPSPGRASPPPGDEDAGPLAQPNGARESTQVAPSAGSAPAYR